MTIPLTVKRILSATPLALVAAWLLTPSPLTTDHDEELAQRGITVTNTPLVLGSSVEGVAVLLHSDSATTATIEIESTDGPSADLVKLPYAIHLDDNVLSFSVTATVDDQSTISCSIEQNTTVLDTNSQAGSVDCAFRLDDLVKPAD